MRPYVIPSGFQVVRSEFDQLPRFGPNGSLRIHAVLRAEGEHCGKKRVARLIVIFEYLEAFYNRQRLHSSLGYVSPVTFEQQAN